MTPEQIAKHNQKFKRDRILFWVGLVLFTLAMIYL